MSVALPELFDNSNGEKVARLLGDRGLKVQGDLCAVSATDRRLILGGLVFNGLFVGGLVCSGLFVRGVGLVCSRLLGVI